MRLSDRTRGRVLIFLRENGAEVGLKVLGEGEVFGEMSLIDNSVRSASCCAVSETQLIIVTKDQLLDRIQAADPVVRLLMRALLERLRSQNSIMRGKKPAETKETEARATERKAALEQIELENRIAAALERDEFTPFYQPIYDLKHFEVIGCEALMRWLPQGGAIIGPADFMDTFEQSSMILQAGQLTIDKCLSDLSKMDWKTKLKSGFFVAINVSGRQFAEPDFVEKLEATRIQSGLESNRIKLEVTERVMMEGPLALATLQKCKALGYGLAIDDFGTGFSSLQYLASMPLNELKIDRSFVMNMLTHAKSHSIVQALIDMARRLGMEVIAEGIETTEQLEAFGKNSASPWAKATCFQNLCPSQNSFEFPHARTFQNET